MSKRSRHKTIKELIAETEISNQEDLLNLLLDKGFSLTQATLSRDMKELKIIKAPATNGVYIYHLPEKISVKQSNEPEISLSAYGFMSIDFSGQLAVVKTRPGYAMSIASEIDVKATDTVLGTVAGDDTILLIPKENISREEIILSLSKFIPSIIN